MGLWDTFTDLVEAATPWSTAEAEHPDSHKSPQGDAPLGGNAPAAPAKEIVRVLPAQLSSVGPLGSFGYSQILDGKVVLT